jgi:hypothetical protein
MNHLPQTQRQSLRTRTRRQTNHGHVSSTHRCRYGIRVEAPIPASRGQASWGGAPLIEGYKICAGCCLPVALQGTHLPPRLFMPVPPQATHTGAAVAFNGALRVGLTGLRLGGTGIAGLPVAQANILDTFMVACNDCQYVRIVFHSVVHSLL